MAVGVDVLRAFVVTVYVHMHALADQLPGNVNAQQDEHHTDATLEKLCRRFRHDGGRKHDERADRKQSYRVTEAPGGTLHDTAAQGVRANDERGNGSQVIGFERMAHADQQPKKQRGGHAGFSVTGGFRGSGWSASIVDSGFLRRLLVWTSDNSQNSAALPSRYTFAVILED
jgi:hypothetical protein